MRHERLPEDLAENLGLRNGHKVKTENRLLAGRFDIAKAITDGIEPWEQLEPDVLLEGVTHHFFGSSECGKTMLALALAKRQIEAEQYVVYFDEENGPKIIAERLELMGADPELLEEYLLYLPFPDLTIGAEDRLDFYEILDDFEPALVVFDSWASFLSSAGLSENENSEIEAWDYALTKQAKNRGITSIIIDHVGHDATDRTRGGIRKRDVGDVQWQVKKTQEYNRHKVGEILLTRRKDRLSTLPKYVTYSVGGNDEGKLICKRSEGTIEVPAEGEELTPKEQIVLDTLIREFPNGARMTAWQQATLAHEVSKATHINATHKLTSDKVSWSNRVRQVDKTYYPPDRTDPPDGDETTESPIDKPNTDWSNEVQFRSNQTNQTRADQDGLTGLAPLEGATVRPSAETTDSPSRQEGNAPPEAEATNEQLVPLSVDQVATELRSPNSGPRKNLPLYIAGDVSLEILTRSVLRARALPTDTWRAYTDVVERAVAANHPVECECERCL